MTRGQAESFRKVHLDYFRMDAESHLALHGDFRSDTMNLDFNMPTAILV